MILAALNDFYQRALDDPAIDIPRPGTSSARVSYALVIKKDGTLVSVQDLRVSSGKKLVGINMTVPEQAGRSGVTPKPYFLCDNAKFFFGAQSDTADNPYSAERLAQYLEESVKLHEAVLGAVDDDGARAVLAFLRRREELELSDVPMAEREGILDNANMVFRLSDDTEYVHMRPAVAEVWEEYAAEKSSGALGQCLITGKMGAIAQVHMPVKGLYGGQSTGGALVTFNDGAFCSYGKEQAFNAPVGEATAAGYVAALNYLLANPRHYRRMAGSTLLFWAERDAPKETAALGQWFDNADFSQEEDVLDKQAQDWMIESAERLSRGLPMRAGEFDESVRFHLLMLAPNAARISVRFYMAEPFGALARRAAQHQADMRVICPAAGNWPELITPRAILKQTAVQGKWENVPPTLDGSLAEAILRGGPYPRLLYQAVLGRIRAHDGVNPVRAGIIKAFLLRNARRQSNTQEMEALTVSLNTQCTDSAYLLGRLFALIERAQELALPGLNATIRDRFFASASSAPAATFPTLMRNAQHHISAVKGKWLDIEIQNVVGSLGTSFPKHLSLDQQGVFILGYYQQRQQLFTRKTADVGEAEDNKEA